VNMALRIAPLVFVAAVVQVATISGTRILGAEPDILLITVIAVALVAGSIPGAVAGFAGGMLVDTMSLGTLGTSSILLILAGYWAGRYGETTGRGRAYAPSLAAFAITIVVAVGGIAVHFLLGQSVSARTALVSALPTAVLAAGLVIPVHRIARALVGPALRFERPRQAEFV
jgi:rod shape-determining protein MreD